MPVFIDVLKTRYLQTKIDEMDLNKKPSIGKFLLIKYIFILFSIVNTYHSYAQSVCQLSQKQLDLYLCVNDYTSIKSSASLTLGLSQIISEIGLSGSNFTMKTCNSIQNAVAVIIDGERKLLLDEHYLSKLNNSANSSFYLYILAHEIGHHLNGHTLKRNDISTSRKQELEADYFAGFMLKKLNNSIQDITMALNSIPHPNDNTGTHPVLSERIFSAKNGFADAALKEQGILRKFEPEITGKLKSANKTNTLNLARSFYNKYAETENIAFFDSSRRYYEELINKKLFGDIPFIELSYLHKLNGDKNSSMQILNEIQSPNDYTALLLYESYNQLELPIPTKIETLLNNIDHILIKDFGYQIILANYYLEKGKIEKSTRIFNNLKAEIDSNNDESIDKLTQIHFYGNYSRFLNSQKEFDQAIKFSKETLDLVKTSEKLTQKSANMLLKTTYNVYAFALLGVENFALLEQILSDWSGLNLNQNERNGDFLYLTARLQEEMGKTLEAIKSFQLYLKFNNDPYANFHLGKCYLEVNDNNSACLEFKTSCENDVELACRYLKIKCNE